MSRVVSLLSEAQFQAQVIELAERCNWRVAHFHDSRRSIGNGRMVGDSQAAGFPDLVLVRDGRLVFAELKRDGQNATEVQEQWLLALSDVEERAGGSVVHVAVWRPADWDVIVKRLSNGGWE